MWQSQTVHNAQNNKENNAQKNDDKLMTLGMTSAISAALPKPSDLIKTKELEESLKPFDVFETEQELNQRMLILGKLYNLVRQWIKDVSLKHNMPESVSENVGGKVYTFGSYRLGVHNKGADIDALCVAPCHIHRLDFFTSFYEVLKNHPEVTDLRAVEEAFVPVIKMNFDGIEIDMLFARLLLKEIPDSMDLRDDLLLKNLDQKCVRSLNGCRVTDEILRLVPNIENFRLALRAIKLWAKSKYPGPLSSNAYHNTAYPQQNSTFNVSQSTRHIMMEEFKLGLHTTDEIMAGKYLWDKLFEPPPFFLKYKHFIVLLVMADSADDHLEWCGLVESKVRLLIGNLERNQYITLAHINPENFSMLEPQKDPSTNCSMWFIGLEFAKTENLNVDLTRDIQMFTETVNKHAMSIQMLKAGMRLEARHVKRRQLSQYLSPSLLKRERKSSISNKTTNGLNEVKKRLSCETTGPDADIPTKKTRLSEEISGNFDESSNASINNDSNSNFSMTESESNISTHSVPINHPTNATAAQEAVCT